MRASLQGDALSLSAKVSLRDDFEGAPPKPAKGSLTIWNPDMSVKTAPAGLLNDLQVFLLFGSSEKGTARRNYEIFLKLSESA